MIEMKITNECNMQLMSRYSDGHFDLAIVDPPYGIGASEMTLGLGKNKKWEKDKAWDNEAPNKEYFNELFRVSKNQIIWEQTTLPICYALQGGGYSGIKTSIPTYHFLLES